MMNSMDKEEIVKALSEQLRTKVGHRSVDLTSADINDFRNFVDDVLSKYVDDQHLLNNER